MAELARLKRTFCRCLVIAARAIWSCCRLAAGMASSLLWLPTHRGGTNQGGRRLFGLTLLASLAWLIYVYAKFTTRHRVHSFPCPDCSDRIQRQPTPEPPGIRSHCRQPCSDPDEHSYWIKSGFGTSEGPLICFDGCLIIDPKRNETFSRGVNVVVINGKLRTAMDYRSFDISASPEACLELVQYLSFHVPPGSPVLMASHDDASSSFCPQAGELFSEFGSSEIYGIHRRESWAFYGQKGFSASQAREKVTTKLPIENYAKVAEIDGCLKIPVASSPGQAKNDLGLTIDFCGLTDCKYRDIAVYISTGEDVTLKPQICVAGKYVIKPGLMSGRGFNFVVVEPITKRTIAIRHFDSSLRESSEIDLFLEGISDNMVLIGLVHDEGTQKLQNGTRMLLADFGATLVWELGYRSIMYFVGRKGLRESPFQNVSHPPNTEQFPVPLEKRFCLPHDLADVTAQMTDLKKESFCKGHEGYGGFCYRSLIGSPKHVPEAALDEVFKVPIIVASGFNHLSLSAALNALNSVPGLRPDRVTVAYYDIMAGEFNDLVRLFSFNAFEVSGVSSSHELMEVALAHVWAANEDTANVIVLEEEAIVSPGFLAYMHKVLLAMSADTSIGAASAWNPNSFSHSAADQSAVYHVDEFVGLAFLLSKSFYQKHMAGRLMLCCARRSWLGWFRGDHSTEGHRFLMPEVARADVYRSSDTYLMSVTPSLAALSRGNRLLPKNFEKDANILPLPGYQDFLLESIRHRVQSSNIIPHLCIADGWDGGSYLTNASRAKHSLAIVYDQEHADDYESFFELCDCFRLACLSTSRAPLGTFNGLMRLTLRGQPMFLVGSKSKYLLPS